MNISHRLAAFASSVRYEGLPDNIKKDIRQRLVDYAASAAAGWKVNREMNAIALEVLLGQGGEGRCSLFFSTRASASYRRCWLLPRAADWTMRLRQRQ